MGMHRYRNTTMTSWGHDVLPGRRVLRHKISPEWNSLAGAVHRYFAGQQMAWLCSAFNVPRIMCVRRCHVNHNQWANRVFRKSICSFSGPHEVKSVAQDGSLPDGSRSACDVWFDSFYVRVSTTTAIYTVGHRLRSTPHRRTGAGSQRSVFSDGHAFRPSMHVLTEVDVA